MPFIPRLKSAAPAALIALAFIVVGCDDSKDTTQTPSTPATESQAAAEQPKTTSVAPLIKTTQLADWCPEHGVPESVCTRCNESLIASFKETGDWDDAHGLPKSQCFKCDPSLKDKFAVAYKEKYGKDAPAISDDHDHKENKTN